MLVELSKQELEMVISWYNSAYVNDNTFAPDDQLYSKLDDIGWDAALEKP